MKAIHIGKMNKRVKILKYTEGTDEIGQNISEFQEEKRMWATVKPIRGGEYYEALKILPEITFVLYTRYRTDIHTDTILEYRGRKLEVKYVADVDEEHTLLEIQCVEYIKKVEHGL